MHHNAQPNAHSPLYDRRQNCVIKCKNFHCHSNTVSSLANIWLTPLNTPTLKTSGHVQEFGTYSNTSQSIANFVFKYPNFRYRGNSGPSAASLSDIIK